MNRSELVEILNSLPDCEVCMYNMEMNSIVRVRSVGKYSVDEWEETGVESGDECGRAINPGDEIIMIGY